MGELMENFGLLYLSVSERLELIEELLDSILQNQGPPPISEQLRRELDRRVRALDANAEPGVPWEEVKARLLVKFETLTGRAKEGDT